MIASIAHLIAGIAVAWLLFTAVAGCTYYEAHPPSENCWVSDDWRTMVCEGEGWEKRGGL